MRSYNQYCPIARGAEIFATRWTPIIIRNLLVGCRSFSAIIDGAPGIPRSLLSERLKQLTAWGLVQRVENGSGAGSYYQLTEAGVELGRVCTALGEWGARWIEVGPQHLDPYFALWSFCKEIPPDVLSEDRLTARFDFRKVRADQRRFWLVVQRPEPEICVKSPGFDEDLIVRTDPESFVRWRLKQVSLNQAMRDGGIEVAGPPSAVRQLRAWAA
ncbi:MAG: winged helix-turn-helix transcriptional regulator [Actinomycetota bacterium]